MSGKIKLFAGLDLLSCFPQIRDSKVCIIKTYLKYFFKLWLPFRPRKSPLKGPNPEAIGVIVTYTCRGSAGEINTPTYP